MKKNMITFLVATMMISVSVAPVLAKQNNQNGKFTPPGQAKKIERLKVQQNSEQDNENEQENERFKYKGLPYGLSKRENLPTGLAKKLELPPGLAKKIQEQIDGDKEFNEEKAEELIKELNDLIEEVINFTEDEDNLLIDSQEDINNLKKLVLDAKKVIIDVDMEDLEAMINKLSNTIESLKEKYEYIVSLKFATTDEIKEYNEYYTRLVNYIDELKNDFEDKFGDNPGQYSLESFIDFYEVIYAEGLIEEDVESTFGELEKNRELLKEAFEKFEDSSLQESLDKVKLVIAATKEEINNYNSMITSLKKGLDEIESQVGTLYTIKGYIAYYNFIYELEFIEEDELISIVELNGIKDEIKLIVNEFIVIKQLK